jgi:hypothetical protein
VPLVWTLIWPLVMIAGPKIGALGIAGVGPTVSATIAPSAVAARALVAEEIRPTVWRTLWRGSRCLGRALNLK